jgi:predicted enzyme related to lactoylglutathione lyase
MLSLNSIMIGSHQPKTLAAFYEKVFGRPSEMPGNDAPGADWFGWRTGGSFLTIGPHSEVADKAREPQRIILNLATDEVRQEFDRLVNAGATAVKEPYEMEGAWIATLADPDGNYFQLMTPWKEK